MKILVYTSEKALSAMLNAFPVDALKNNGNQIVFNLTSTLLKSLSEVEDTILFAPEGIHFDAQLFPFVPVKLKEKILLYQCLVTKNSEIPDLLIKALQTLKTT